MQPLDAYVMLWLAVLGLGNVPLVDLKLKLFKFVELIKDTIIEYHLHSKSNLDLEI